MNYIFENFRLVFLDASMMTSLLPTSPTALRTTLRATCPFEGDGSLMPQAANESCVRNLFWGVWDEITNPDLILFLPRLNQVLKKQKHQ